MRAQRHGLSLAIMVGLILGCVTPNAGAFLRDYQVSSFSSPDNSSLKKSLRFDCPRALSEPQAALGAGAGAQGSGNGNELAIQRAIAGVKPNPAALIPPGSPFNSMDIGAASTDPTNDRWGLRAQTFCATNTMVAPTANDVTRYVKDIRIVRASSVSDSSRTAGFKAVDATCTGNLVPGRTLTPIGGGFMLDNGTFNNLPPRQVTAHFATRLATGFRTTAGESDPTDKNWRIRSYAICANLGAPIDPQSGTTTTSQFVTSITTVSGSSTSGQSRSPRSAFAMCPRGTFTVGGGAEVRRQGSQASNPVTNNVAITSSAPVVFNKTTGGVLDAAAFNGEAWLGSAQEVDATDSDWDLQVRATCAALGPVVL